LATWEQVSPAPIRQKSGEADAGESARQHVQEEPTQEFFATNGHRPLHTPVRVVLPPERDLAVGDVDDPVIRDRHAVRVAGQILQHMFGSAEGAFGIDDPVVTKEGGAGTRGTRACRPGGEGSRDMRVHPSDTPASNRR